MGKKSQSLPELASNAWTDHTHWTVTLDSHGLDSSQQKLFSLSSQESGSHTSLLHLKRLTSDMSFNWERFVTR